MTTKALRYRIKRLSVVRFIVCLFLHRPFWYEPRAGRREINCTKCGPDPEKPRGRFKSIPFLLHYKCFHVIGHYLRDPLVWLWNHSFMWASYCRHNESITARIGDQEWIDKIREADRARRSKHIPFSERKKMVRRSNLIRRGSGAQVSGDLMDSLSESPMMKEAESNDQKPEV